MSKLTEMIEAVKEENLTKDQLEKYHTEITYLDNMIRMEVAPIEKDEALYFQSNKQNIIHSNSPNGFIPVIRERSDIEIKRMWRATEQGQRQIELNHYLKITPKLLQSIRTRLYNIY